MTLRALFETGIVRETDEYVILYNLKYVVDNTNGRYTLKTPDYYDHTVERIEYNKKVKALCIKLKDTTYEVYEEQFNEQGHIYNRFPIATFYKKRDADDYIESKLAGINEQRIDYTIMEVK